MESILWGSRWELFLPILVLYLQFIVRILTRVLPLMMPTRSPHSSYYRRTLASRFASPQEIIASTLVLDLVGLHQCGLLSPVVAALRGMHALGIVLMIAHVVAYVAVDTILAHQHSSDNGALLYVRPYIFSFVVAVVCLFTNSLTIIAAVIGHGILGGGL